MRHPPTIFTVFFFVGCIILNNITELPKRQNNMQCPHANRDNPDGYEMIGHDLFHDYSVPHGTEAARRLIHDRMHPYQAYRTHQVAMLAKQRRFANAHAYTLHRARWNDDHLVPYSSA
jgi:hypothetical protein